MWRRALLLAMLTASCSRRADAPQSERTDGFRAGPAIPQRTSASRQAGVAVVELFTSEGCSSCPPADAKLARLAGRPGVVALSFHVDYWNYLGWRDPWSDARWSARQQRYDRGGNVYTPQFVVDGASADDPGDAVGRALSIPGRTRVWLSVRRGTDRRDVTAQWRVEDAPAGAALEIAFARREASDAVGRGENAGRRLAHADVVRELVEERLDARTTGATTRRLPDGAPLLVAAFVQDGRSLAVTGAAADGVE